MPSNSKRPTPAPTSLPKQTTSMNTSKKSGSKPASNSAVNSANAGAAKSKSGPSAASGGEAPMEPSGQQNAAQHPSGNTENPGPTVNRKKQKRRQKQAARLAAEQQQLSNGYSSANSHDHQQQHPTYTQQHHHRDTNRSCMEQAMSGMDPNYADHDFEDADQYEPVEGEDLYYTDEEGRLFAQPHAQGQFSNHGFGSESHGPGGRKGKKKKGKKAQSISHETSTSHSTPSTSVRPQLSNAVFRTAHKISKDRIWNTSTQEERENIKEFWLHLGEEERRSLVKVEKEAVLRKMKEQQKHSCSCTVCGRKRTAIEEELEVLYDAYYEELEQYAHHNKGSLENGTPIVSSQRLYQTSLRPPLDHHSHMPHTQHPPRGRIQELPDDDDDDDLEDEYDEDDEDDEPYSDDDDELDDHARTTRADFFAFGNSLTVKDGILTVADDLLKNDGKHFIDMMEQLAERRMQREEDTHYASASAAHHMHSGHNHGPPLDEEDYDEEDEEDYDSQEEEEYEDDDMDTMTEEQRMEEGRRMFQIFAARMFEQRVLTAYREKVARERQQKLIEELEEENRLDEEREAKKAREAQKKKDKKRLQKQAKEEERARREAEKAAEEAAAKALEEKKLEEQRKKKEEQRKKKEAERKAQEEERARKEAERIKERERQAEVERKQREQKEREKKKREEAKKKAREEREAKEKESREKKLKEEQERKAREEQAKKEKEAADKAEREAKEMQKRDEQAAQPSQPTHATTQAAKRNSQSGTGLLPPGLQHPQGPSALQSPHLPFTTPVVPKAPTPVRPRQPSHQGSHASSPRSQQAGTEVSQTSISPENLPFSYSSGTSSSASTKGLNQQPILHHPQPSAPMSPLGAPGRGHPSHGFHAVHASNGVPTNPPGIPGMAPRPPMGHDLPMGAQSQSGLSGQFRNFAPPNSIPVPPGINGNRPMTGNRGAFTMEPHHGMPHYHAAPPVPMPITTHQSHLPREGERFKTHSRQQSGSFERSPLEQQTQTMPIARPAPIQRPPSAAPSSQVKDESQKSTNVEVDDLSTQLGSSALLDDTDVPLASNLSQSLPTAPPGVPGAPGAPGALGSGRLGFAAPPPLFSDPMAMSKHSNFHLGSGNQGGTWGSQMPFAPSGFPSSSSWGTGPGAGWSNNAFGTINVSHRLHASRPMTIRLMVSQACKQLTGTSSVKDNTGFHNVNHVLQKVEQLKSPNEPPVTLNEMLEICDTEGNSQNGGGSFIIKNEGNQGKSVKFEPDNNSAPSGARGSIAPGDIGSPVPGSSVPAFGGNIGASAPGSRQFQPQANISSPTGF